jgi:hypothetical protein
MRQEEGARITGSSRQSLGVLVSWRFVAPRNSDLLTIGQHVVGADSVSLSSNFQMRFPWRPTGLAVEGLGDIAALYVTLSGEWLQRAKHPLVSWESTVSLD